MGKTIKTTTGNCWTKLKEDQVGFQCLLILRCNTVRHDYLGVLIHNPKYEQDWMQQRRSTLKFKWDLTSQISSEGGSRRGNTVGITPCNWSFKNLHLIFITTNYLTAKNCEAKTSQRAYLPYYSPYIGSSSKSVSITPTLKKTVNEPSSYRHIRLA